MARSRKELLTHYEHLIRNTGGNDPLELAERLEKETNLSFTNMPVFILAMSVESQLALLERLDDQGFLI